MPVSRTVGESTVVDEFIFRFTHTTRIDWMLPGIAPTGRRVEIPMVAIVQFQGLPVAGVETAQKVLDVSLPSNALM